MFKSKHKKKKNENMWVCQFDTLKTLFSYIISNFNIIIIIYNIILNNHNNQCYIISNES